MIPTVTYDQVRIEQENRLAHLERRRHAHEAGSFVDLVTDRLSPVTSGWRAAVALGALLVIALAAAIA
jgi:hypothetical protein